MVASAVSAVAARTLSGSTRRGPAVGQPCEDEQDERQREAPVHVGPDDGHHRYEPEAPAVAARRHAPQAEGEQRHPELLGAKLSDELDPDQPPGDRQQGAEACRRPLGPTRREHEAERHREQRGTSDREAEPSPPVEDARKDDLGSPLLVQPRLAADRERERVDVGQVMRGDHVRSRPQPIGEVHRHRLAERRHRDGQRDRDRRPDVGQRELPAARPSVHRAPYGRSLSVTSSKRYGWS